MKKLTLTVITLTALTACTASPEMISAQKDRCTQVGYQIGTVDHAHCVERGTMQQQATQGAVLAGAAEAAIWTVLWQ